MEFEFEVPGPPVPKGRPRLARNGRTFTPQRTIRYERAVRDAAFRYRPESWPMRERYSVVIQCFVSDSRRRDLDNVAKSILDGMNGAAWDDDSQVDALVVVRDRSQKGFDRATISVRVMRRQVSA